HDGLRPLTEQGMGNAIAFTRLPGYVRHFQPSDQAAAADWNMLAVEGMRQIEPCDGGEQLAKALEAFFRPVAPTMQVFPSGTQPAAPAGLTPPAGAAGLQRVSWLHLRGGPGRDKDTQPCLSAPAYETRTQAAPPWFRPA